MASCLDLARQALPARRAVDQREPGHACRAPGQETAGAAIGKRSGRNATNSYRTRFFLVVHERTVHDQRSDVRHRRREPGGRQGRRNAARRGLRWARRSRRRRKRAPLRTPAPVQGVPARRSRARQGLRPRRGFLRRTGDRPAPRPFRRESEPVGKRADARRRGAHALRPAAACHRRRASPALHSRRGPRRRPLPPQRRGLRRAAATARPGRRGGRHRGWLDRRGSRGLSSPARPRRDRRPSRTGRTGTRPRLRSRRRLQRPPHRPRRADPRGNRRRGVRGHRRRRCRQPLSRTFEMPDRAPKIPDASSLPRSRRDVAGNALKRRLQLRQVTAGIATGSREGRVWVAIGISRSG